MTIEGTATDDTSNGVEQQRLPSKQRRELDAEGIRSSIARLSSSSVVKDWLPNSASWTSS